MSRWFNISTLESKKYICGYCNESIASDKGYSNENGFEKIYICHSCGGANYFYRNEQKYSQVIYGKNFKVSIPEDINKLYNETRKCYGVGSYTAVALCCRKLLMHIAVSCGADENLKFIEYVNYLDAENYIPKNSKSWVDIIRNKGNEATHEIKISDEKEAQQLIKFIEIIITLIYEIELEIEE